MESDVICAVFLHKFDHILQLLGLSLLCDLAKCPKTNLLVIVSLGIKQITRNLMVQPLGQNDCITKSKGLPIGDLNLVGVLFRGCGPQHVQNTETISIFFRTSRKKICIIHLFWKEYNIGLAQVSMNAKRHSLYLK